MRLADLLDSHSVPQCFTFYFFLQNSGVGAGLVSVLGTSLLGWVLGAVLIFTEQLQMTSMNSAI